MTVEKGEHGSSGMRNGLGQTIPLVQQNYIKEINGWYWRDVASLNETLNNDVTYWGYIVAVYIVVLIVLFHVIM